MNQNQINTLHEIMSHFFEKENFCLSEVLGFLSITLIGTMAMNEYSDDFADRTFDKMKNDFRKKKMDLKNAKAIDGHTGISEA